MEREIELLRQDINEVKQLVQELLSYYKIDKEKKLLERTKRIEEGRQKGLEFLYKH